MQKMSGIKKSGLDAMPLFLLDRLFTVEFECIILIYWKVLFQLSISKNCPILVFFDKFSYMLTLALDSWCHLLQYGWTLCTLGSNGRYHICQWPDDLRSPCSDTGKCVDENFSKSVSVMIFRLYDFAKMMAVSADKYIRFHFNKSRVSFHSKNTRNSVVIAIK